MKQIFFTFLLGIALIFVLLTVLAFCMALPRIVDWLAIYVGDLAAWSLVLISFLGFIGCAVRIIDK